MRGRHAASSLVVVGLIAACATSTPVHETTGVGGAGTGTGWLVGVTGGGTRGCGVNSSDMTCTGCINARCCAEGKACGADPNCLSCVGAATPPTSCESNQELSTFTLCLQSVCANACLGGSSSSSSAGAGGGSSSSSSAAASTSAGTSASSASSSSSTSSSSSSTTSSSSSSSSSSGGAPTCASVDGNAGCCDAGGILHYCTNGQTVQDLTCGSTQVCGWNATASYYDCVAAPGGADPSGTYPSACGG